jgi:hypothetical protein
LIFSTSLFRNISHYKKNWARYYHKYINRSPCKVTLLLSHFNETWIFSTDFRKMLEYQISWKSFSRSQAVPCGPTDMMKLIVAFRNFANAPEKTPETILGGTNDDVHHWAGWWRSNAPDV